MCDDPENTHGMLMTGAITIVANVLVYLGYRKIKQTKIKHKKKECDIAFASYQKKSETVNNYLVENQIFYNSSYNNENKNRGLVIIEAYYGLADHIYSVEAGLLKFSIPDTSAEYANQQILPVTK